MLDQVAADDDLRGGQALAGVERLAAKLDPIVFVARARYEGGIQADAAIPPTPTQAAQERAASAADLENRSTLDRVGEDRLDAIPGVSAESG